MGMIVIPIPLSLAALVLVLVFIFSFFIVGSVFIYIFEHFNLFPSVKEDTINSILCVLAGVFAVFITIVILTTVGIPEPEPEKHFQIKLCGDSGEFFNVPRAGLISGNMSVKVNSLMNSETIKLNVTEGTTSKPVVGAIVHLWGDYESPTTKYKCHISLTNYTGSDGVVVLSKSGYRFAPIKEKGCNIRTSYDSLFITISKKGYSEKHISFSTM